MKRGFSSALVVSLLLACFMPASVAASTPKVGGACTKVGQTSIEKSSSKKLVCNKSGKKLVWSYPATQVSTSAETTPSVPATPATPIIDPLRAAAFNSVHAMQCGSGHPHIIVTTTIGTNTPGDVQKAASAEIERTLNCFDSFFDSTIDLQVAFITEKDADLTQSKLPSIMGPQELAVLKNVLARYEARSWGPSGGSGGGVAGKNSFGSNYYLILHLASYTTMESYLLKNIMHEFAHVLQGYGRKDYRTTTSEAWYENVPGYFTEGGADAIAYAFTESTISGYDARLNRSFKNLTEGAKSARNLPDLSAARALLDTIKSPANQEARDVQYPFGAMVCDYIIGKYGVDKFLALMKGASKYPKWGDNVSATLGISQNELETAALTWGLPLWNAATK